MRAKRVTPLSRRGHPGSELPGTGQQHQEVDSEAISASFLLTVRLLSLSKWQCPRL